MTKKKERIGGFKYEYYLDLIKAEGKEDAEQEALSRLLMQVLPDTIDWWSMESRPMGSLGDHDLYSVNIKYTRVKQEVKT